MLHLSRLEMFCKKLFKLLFTSHIVVIAAVLLIVVFVIHRQHDWQRSNLPISLYVCRSCLPFRSLLRPISPWSPCKYEGRRNYWHFCFAQNKTENSKEQKTEQQQTHTLTSRAKGNKTGNKKKKISKKKLCQNE